MRRLEGLLALTILAGLLAGCGAGRNSGSISQLPAENPPQVSQPVQKPPEVPEAPKEPPEVVPKTAQELLEEQPVDDTYGAFLVDTGGELGTLLVTVEQAQEALPEEFYSLARLFVWNPASMDRPIQMMETETVTCGGEMLLDVNFDGHQDITYLWGSGVQAEYYNCWIWSEEQGRFVEEPTYADISSPWVDSETQTIVGWNRNSAAGDGVSTFYKWIDGQLVCVRRIEVWCQFLEDVTSEITVWDRHDGELTEIYHTEFPPGSYAYFDERAKWENLDYHGENM